MTRMFHSLLTGATPFQVDLISDWEIIKLFTSGQSNEQISSLLDIGLDDIIHTLMWYFNQGGWDYSLGVTPTGMYNSSLGSSEDFTKNMRMLGFSEAITSKALEVSIIFEKLKEIKEDYDKSTAS